MDMHVQVEKQSILKRITHFFGKEDAYRQELLQNARRAEAKHVTVSIDTRENTLSVSDDGHGVFNPQSLLTIGRSDWADAIYSEMPAGMGLFSVFKLGSKASIRSKTWRLDLDIEQLNQNKPAKLTEGLPKIKGTTVTVQVERGRLLESTKICQAAIEEAARAWEVQARFMPFDTTIIADGKQVRIVVAFNTRKPPTPETFRVERPWGFIDIMQGNYGYKRYRDDCLLISQGIAVELEKHLFAGTRRGKPSLTIWVHCKPGTVNFRLPDRETAIDDDKFKALLLDARESVVETILQRIDGITDKDARKNLALLVYAFNEDRVQKLPENLQWLRFKEGGGYFATHTKVEVEKRLAQGARILIKEPDSLDALAFLPGETLALDEGDRALLERLLPEVDPVVEYKIDVEADKRGETLWRVKRIHLTHKSSRAEDLQPEKERSALVSSAWCDDLSFPAHKDADERSTESILVLHSCQDEVETPSLDLWYSEHEEEYSGAECEALWRTSQQNRDIVATWNGIPACDVTLDELCCVLNDKLKPGDGNMTFRNMNMTPRYESCMDVENCAVLIKETGKPTRVLQLQAKDGRLNLQSETQEPGDPVEEEKATDEEVEVEDGIADHAAAHRK